LLFGLDHSFCVTGDHPGHCSSISGLQYRVVPFSPRCGNQKCLQAFPGVLWAQVSTCGLEETPSDRTLPVPVFIYFLPLLQVRDSFTFSCMETVPLSPSTPPCVSCVVFPYRQQGPGLKQSGDSGSCLYGNLEPASESLAFHTSLISCTELYVPALLICDWADPGLCGEPFTLVRSVP
jgi:hypothetical protein